MKHEDFIKNMRKVQKNLLKVKTPFRGIYLSDYDGGVIFPTDAEYSPKEAVKVALWILDYYGEHPEEK